MLYHIYNKIIIGKHEFQPILAQVIYFAGLNHSFTTPSNEKEHFKTASLRQSQYRVSCTNFSSCKVQIYFKNIYLNLLLMHAQVSTESRFVSPGMYESLLHGNREMHLLPCFRFSHPLLHRQYQSESPEIVNRFGNYERALR